MQESSVITLKIMRGFLFGEVRQFFLTLPVGDFYGRRCRQGFLEIVDAGSFDQP